MRKRTATATVISTAALFFSLAAPAGAQDITVVNASHVAPALLHHVETVVARQVNVDLHRYWRHAAHIRFADTAHAWRVTLVKLHIVCSKDVGCLPGLAGSYDHGWHDRWAHAEVGTDAGSGWEITLSHEVLEMAVDPYLRTFIPGTNMTIEICDSYEEFSYVRDGVGLSDFATPAFFGLGSARGRQDFLNLPV